MDFADRINAHSKRVMDLREHISNEEATKQSLILPFFNILGYDTFDPRVVVPEYTADVGSKKGERVDYAIKRNGEIIMLVEAKSVGDALDESKAAQLRRYFNALHSAKLGILTDGVKYKFFSDLDKPNVMDDKPFMVFDFAALDTPLVDELKKLCNDAFDIDVALSAAQEMKYLRALKEEVVKELTLPSDELVKIFARRVHGGTLWQNVLGEFRERLRVAFEHHINDVLNARLQLAIQPNTSPGRALEGDPGAEDASVPAATVEPEFTGNEIQVFYLVKSVLMGTIDPERVFLRNVIGLGRSVVVLDDSIRKPLLRLNFNKPEKLAIGLIGEDKKDNFVAIEKLDDILLYTDAIRCAALRHDAPGKKYQTEGEA
ncbi:MAG: type I restriction enzyme HsdR N-terminal domain-containing protein [Deltaproteobacteria bacterium]|jgi:hypothetical protein|nr:type I restriction enzyme HsdR N-terminal domain-containing protein [Deltaproteobacteria bacterium]